MNYFQHLRFAHCHNTSCVITSCVNTSCVITESLHILMLKRKTFSASSGVHGKLPLHNWLYRTALLLFVFPYETCRSASFWVSSLLAMFGKRTNSMTPIGPIILTDKIWLRMFQPLDKEESLNLFLERLLIASLFCTSYHHLALYLTRVLIRSSLAYTISV